MAMRTHSERIPIGTQIESGLHAETDADLESATESGTLRDGKMREDFLLSLNNYHPRHSDVVTPPPKLGGGKRSGGW